MRNGPGSPLAISVGWLMQPNQNSRKQDNCTGLPDKGPAPFPHGPQNAAHSRHMISGSAVTGNPDMIGLIAAIAVLAGFIYMLCRPCREKDAPMGQSAHPHPQEDLPFFLLRIMLTIITVTTTTRIALPPAQDKYCFQVIFQRFL